MVAGAPAVLRWGIIKLLRTEKNLAEQSDITGWLSEKILSEVTYKYVNQQAAARIRQTCRV